MSTSSMAERGALGGQSMRGEIVGRARELDRLRRLIADTGQVGAARALVLVGEAGIGKSTLLGVAVKEAELSGHRVLQTAGVEAESQLAFAALHRLLRPILSLSDTLSPAEGGALQRALGMTGGTISDPALVQMGTLSLLGRAAREQSVVVVVDDVHWLDSATRAVVAYLARHLSIVPFALLAASRPGYDDELSELEVERVDIGGLSPEDALRLLDRSRAAFPASIRERVLSEAGGNPLALLELPELADEEEVVLEERTLPITDRLERAFTRRVAEMPETTQMLLLVAASDHASSATEVITAVRRLLGGPVEPRYSELAAAAGLVRIGDDGIAWRHPLVRSAVYQAADPIVRSRVHEAMADAIADVDRRTWHRAAAADGPDDAVAAAVEAMALRVQGRGAILDASFLLRRAAELSLDTKSRVDRLLRAGELAFQLGRGDLVREIAAEIGSLPLSSRAAARLQLLEEMFSDGTAGDVDRLSALVSTARRAAADGDYDLALEMLRGAALRCWWAAMPWQTRKLVLDTVEKLDVDQFDPRLLTIVAIVAPLERGSAVLERLPSALEAVGDDLPRRQLLGIAAHAVGDHDTAIAILDPLVARLREEGRLGLLAQVESMLQWDAVMLGAWHAARHYAVDGDRLAQATGQRVWGAGLTCGLAMLAAVGGHEERAESLSAEAEAVIVPHGLADMHSVLLTARGVSALVAGRPQHALALLLRLFEPEDPAHHYREQFGALTYLADAAVLCSRTAEASDILVELGRLVREFDASPLLDQLQYADAVLSENVETLERELEVRLAQGRAFDAGRLRLLLGVLLVRNGRAASGRRRLREAARTFGDAAGWSRLALELESQSVAQE